jgi:hypothetical protein
MSCCGVKGAVSHSPIFQDDLINLQDASNEVMMIMDDEEKVKVRIHGFIT